MSTPQAPRPTSSKIVFMSGLAIIAIAIFQTVTDGAPDKYTAGALLALALGGGVGHIADAAIKGYISNQIKQLGEQTPPPPKGGDDETL